MRAGVLLCAFLVCIRAHAATFYVVADPAKDGPGTDKANPTGKLCQVIEQTKDGDTVNIAEGTYSLTQPCLVSKRRISLLGGWKADFSTRDVFMSIARLTAAQGALLQADNGADDLLVEGVMFDGAASNAFGSSICADCFAGGYDAKSMPSLVMLEQAGRVRFKGVIFANAPGGAITANLRSALALESVAVVNARPFGIHVTGSCGYAAPRCVDLSVKSSTFAWTWRETIADNSLGGTAILVGSGVAARVEKTVIAYSDRAGVEVESEQNTELGVLQLVVFDNKASDLLLGGKGYAINMVNAESGVAGGGPYGRMERLALPWDIDYLNRYLARGKDRFYGAKLPQNRVFMLSPAMEGLKPFSGTRLTYEAAVSGSIGTQTVGPTAATGADDDKKKGKKKVKKGKR